MSNRMETTLKGLVQSSSEKEEPGVTTTNPQGLASSSEGHVRGAGPRPHRLLGPGMGRTQLRETRRRQVRERDSGPDVEGQKGAGKQEGSQGRDKRPNASPLHLLHRTQSTAF